MDTEETKQQLATILEDAQKKQSEIKTEFDALVQTKEELKGKIAQIRGFHTSAENKDSQLVQLLTSAQQSKATLDSAQTRVEQLKNEMEGYYQKFTELKTKLDDPENGLNKNLEWSQHQRDEIDTKHQEVAKLQGQAEILKEEIEGYKGQILQTKDESDQLKASIAKTLDLVTTSSLAGSFTGRRDIEAKVTKKWFWGLMISTTLLGGAFLWIYWSFAKNGLADWHLFFRYLIASPFIYLVYVCSHNYNLERNYEERYAFKAVLATSLESYIKLFSDKFPDEKEKLLEFMLKTLATIYKEPYTDTDEVKEVYGGFWNIFNFGFKNNKSKPKIENKTGNEVASNN